jgi:hypothetical protein
MNQVFLKEKQNDLNKLYNGKIIPFSQKLKYLFIMPCVNRLERNAIQVIDKTFDNFENNKLFDNIENVEWKFLLLESGSKDLTYLKSIYPYFEKYKNHINIIYSHTPLDGPKNIFRIFDIASKLKEDEFDFIIWMDDDIVVCENFLKNCDYWIRNYMNFTVFGSLYSPYHSFPVPNLNSNICKQSYVRSYHGSCCTIFKPLLAKYILPLFFKTNLLRNVVEPDLRFRESIMKFFPNVQYFLVSYPSLVYHLNIGSAIYGHKQVKKGHQCREFIGTSNDPKWYLNYEFYKEQLKSQIINKNIIMEIQPTIQSFENKVENNDNNIIINNNYDNDNIDKKDNINNKDINKKINKNPFLFGLFNSNIDMDISRY